MEVEAIGEGLDGNTICDGTWIGVSESGGTDEKKTRLTLDRSDMTSVSPMPTCVRDCSYGP